MMKLLSLTGSLLFAAIVSASAADAPATNAGSHAMPAQKQLHMSDRVMPSKSAADAPATNAVPAHSKESMTAGSHTMPAQKQLHMSDRVMPSKSKGCSEEALAKMPADHRAACGK